jgi:hypothetical protein
MFEKYPGRDFQETLKYSTAHASRRKAPRAAAKRKGALANSLKANL